MIRPRRLLKSDLVPPLLNYFFSNSDRLVPFFFFMVGIVKLFALQFARVMPSRPSGGELGAPWGDACGSRWT